MGWWGAGIPLAERPGVTISLVWCVLNLQSFVTRVSLCLAWFPASIVSFRSLQLGISSVLMLTSLLWGALTLVCLSDALVPFLGTAGSLPGCWNPSLNASDSLSVWHRLTLKSQQFQGRELLCVSSYAMAMSIWCYLSNQVWVGNLASHHMGSVT